jgi:hypothetical protein
MADRSDKLEGDKFKAQVEIFLSGRTNFPPPTASPTVNLLLNGEHILISV